VRTTNRTTAIGMYHVMKIIKLLADWSVQRYEP